ncbi:MAG: NUDIX domain-containing protein [Flavobacteriales bacterium]|jgi:8-oxo-dGTP pyrophosphatase MutT (NUDIX family)|nr:NUDIX domain-containing protein [Flavobacteriales bacterium]
MVRNYEVHIDGKPFIIGERPEFNDLPGNWLAIRVDGPAEMVRAREALVREDGFRGIHAFGADVETLWDWFRRDYRFVQAAGGAVSDGDGRLLAIHRMGRWDLPKGKVEPGERVDAAALREVREECGLKDLRLVRPLCETWHTYTRNGTQHLKRTDWFLMTGDAAEPLTPQTEEDIDAVRWVDAADLAELRRDIYPSLLRVLNAWEVSGRDRA